MPELLLMVAFVLHAGHGGEGQTLIIDSVREGGGAESAGMKAGDRIVGLDGQEIEDLEDLQKIVATKKPGDVMAATVLRDGKNVELSLTLGEMASGGASMGVSIAVYEGEVPEDIGEGFDDCLAWVEDTYKIRSLSEQLGLDLSEEYQANRECVEHDTRTMARADAARYCDNVFKVHCGGFELLAEIGEAQARACEERLSRALGVDVAGQRSWRTCGRHKVIDRYSLTGETTAGESECKTALAECSGEGA